MTSDRYTHGHHESVLRNHRWRTAANSAAYLLRHLQPETSLLDVGCGPGTITASLAAIVAPGSVVALDAHADVVAAAARDHPAPNLSFEVGDVYALRFADASFDVVHAHQLLQHLTDPVAALREMHRVARPGGMVAVRESDYGAFVWSPADERLDLWNRVYHQIARRNGAEPDAGRMLHRWFRTAGFDRLEVTSSTWTFHRPEDRAWWGETWAERVLHSAFARQALEYGLADQAALEQMAAAFREFAAHPDAVFVVLHGEVVATRD